MKKACGRGHTRNKIIKVTLCQAVVAGHTGNKIVKVILCQAVVEVTQETIL
jgi:hypothetical protein